MKNKKYSIVAVLSSLAVVINIIENLFIPPIGFGIRFGLANTISLISLKLFSYKEMLLVVLVRLTLGSLIKGTIFSTSFWIPAIGLLFSSIIILILNKLNCSIKFISMMSAIFHSLGQMLTVSFLYKQINMFVLLPLLIVSSLATGLLTGLISERVIKRFK